MSFDVVNFDGDGELADGNRGGKEGTETDANGLSRKVRPERGVVEECAITLRKSSCKRWHR